MLLYNSNKNFNKNFNIINLKNKLQKMNVHPKYFSLNKNFKFKYMINSLPKMCISYLGTGDFHYISYFLIKRLNIKPFLILFDYHFDMNKSSSNVITCGSWVRQCIKENIIRGVLVIGANKDYYPADLDYLNLYHIEDGNKPFNPIMIKKLKDMFVYVSIDKDVLSSEVLKTNWEQGNMKFESLIKWIVFIKKYVKIIGVDICGEQKFNPLNELLYPQEKVKNKRINKKICKLICCTDFKCS